MQHVARIDRSVPVDPVVKVRPPVAGAEFSEWRISTNLSDRWGEINFHDEERKPLDPLIDDPAFFAHLVSQLWDEETFIVRKDGEFGILFEVEFSSSESDGKNKGSARYKPHAEVELRLQSECEELCRTFPWAEFGIPHPDEINEGRPAIWAFVANNASTSEQRDALGTALLSI